jgi:hypothetical protein
MLLQSLRVGIGDCDHTNSWSSNRRPVCTNDRYLLHGIAMLPICRMPTIDLGSQALRYLCIATAPIRTIPTIDLGIQTKVPLGYCDRTDSYDSNSRPQYTNRGTFALAAAATSELGT